MKYAAYVLDLTVIQPMALPVSRKPVRNRCVLGIESNRIGVLRAVLRIESNRIESATPRAESNRIGCAALANRIESAALRRARPRAEPNRIGCAALVNRIESAALRRAAPRRAPNQIESAAPRSCIGSNRPRACMRARPRAPLRASAFAVRAHVRAHTARWRLHVRTQPLEPLRPVCVCTRATCLRTCKDGLHANDDVRLMPTHTL